MKDSKKIIVTHDGGFHADDAFAVAALLLYLKGNAEVVRTRDQKVIASGDFVVDVGGEYDEARHRFDHHQPGGAGARANTIPYAAFGLVWKKFGVAISGSPEIAVRVDTKLVQPIDAADNGIALGNHEGAAAFPYVIQNAVFAFEPTWNEQDISLDAQFEKAREFAGIILEREIAHARDAALGESRVRAAYETAEDKRIVVLDAKYDWGAVLEEKPEPLFVVTPDRGPSGNWRAHAVRAHKNSFVSRRPFPSAWAGLRDAELARASGVPDAVFCHNKLFTVAARTKEGAIALAKRALEN